VIVFTQPPDRALQDVEVFAPSWRAASILKIRDQRLASEIARLRRKIQKITRQGLRDISLTLGNVGRIFATRT
jgi:hypothetical protein